MGFHRFHLQANRLPFYPPCLHGSQIFKNDGFFWGERRVDEWKPTQWAGWMERQVDEFWEVTWGTNACIGFYGRNYGMFACLPSFPCQMFKWCHPFDFSRFLNKKYEKDLLQVQLLRCFRCFLSASGRCQNFFQTYPGLEDFDHV